MRRFSLIIAMLLAWPQTHTFPALDTSNAFTRSNSFSGNRTPTAGPNAYLGTMNGVLVATNPKYAAADIGAGINNAQANADCPSTGCEVDIPVGSYSFSTPIVISKPIHLNGQLGNIIAGSTGTILNWTGSSGVPISISGASGAASGTILENFDLKNSGMGTIGIDVFNGQYDVVIRNVSMEGRAFSVAGVRLGNNTSGSATINVKLYNLRLAGQVLGLDILFANAIDVYSPSIYNTTRANVQIGDSTHAASNISFHGGNIEQDVTANPSIIVNNAQAVDFFGVYGETIGTGPWLQIPHSATQVVGIRVYGGRNHFNGATNGNFASVNLSSATVSIHGLYVLGCTSRCAIFQGTAAQRLYVDDVSAASSAFSVSNGGGIPQPISGSLDFFTSNIPPIFGSLKSTSGGVLSIPATSSNGAFAATPSQATFMAAPTISSGFGTSPNIANNNGSLTFTINVGTGGTATSGVIGLSTAPHGWDVNCKDITTTSSKVFLTKETATSTTTATVGNFNTSGAAAAWAASDILSCTAAPY